MIYDVHFVVPSMRPSSLPRIDLQEIGDGQACTGDILESEACILVSDPHRCQALEKTKKTKGTWKAPNVICMGFNSAGVQFRALPCGLQAQ